MKRVAFIIDGFNLYHSVRDASAKNGRISTKWLDIHSLCKSYLSVIDKDAALERVYYFSAFATHLGDPAKIERHKAYIACLEDTGVIVSLGRFKEKESYCPNCKRYYLSHEEKETDIAIATQLFELLMNDNCDIVVLATGDTDLVPAVRTAHRLFTGKTILFAFPWGRKNKHLSQLAPNSFKMTYQAYSSHQFADPFTLKNGTVVNKPSSW